MISSIPIPPMLMLRSGSTVLELSLNQATIKRTRNESETPTNQAKKPLSLVTFFTVQIDSYPFTRQMSPQTGVARAWA